MTRIGAPELIIVLVIIVLLFGPGRISNMAGELGKGIRAFKEGISEPKETTKDPDNKSSGESSTEQTEPQEQK